MTYIRSVNTATPAFPLEVQQLNAVAEHWLSEDENTRNKFLKICGNSGVKKRFFIQEYANTLKLNGLNERSALFEEHGTNLLKKVISESLVENQLEPADVGTVIFTSCSVPAIPSIDARALFELGFSPKTHRIPIFQHGCAGGVIGLALGAKIKDDSKAIIVASLELCSLVFQPQNLSGTQLVAAAIFADGAAATVVSKDETGLKFVASQSYLLPNTRHLMGYSIFDDGFHLLLDKGLPQALVETAPKLVADFLALHGETKESIDYWLFHPGGIKILGFLEEAFNLKAEQCNWSRDVLREFGNMSSATIHFVLNAFLKSKKLSSGEKVLIVGIGPGLTLELILLQAV